MSVVRRGTAAGFVFLAVTGVTGAAHAQQAEPTLAPDDPSISEQQADTGTVGLDDPGCSPDPTICESGVTTVDAGAGGTGGAGSGGPQLPRTGPYDRLLATGAVGTALLLAGAGAVTAGRRRQA